ncbi:nuclear transport factor 2 family protein [Dietzia sp. ANT_WB102]|uniref:nuclear transport factor 2 family protein n=1 Tax=Dietzia sp. ANT_WB102 TaxID=2597345 RepID=UPI0011EFB78E|nr:nuclear transport factor 2 family protein [Dietzia sp. ANT_WB102]KAA0917188.1 nuclear transport factor 2 family protein [Dietzia sp. ANT_WB102]
MSSVTDQIVERLADVATALDTRDWDGLGALFTEFATGYGATGREAIVERVRDHLGGCGPSQHLLGNHRVELDLDGDPDRARSRTYGRVLHRGAGDLAGLTYECIGEYTDQWTRTSEGWQISSRWFELSFDLGDARVLRRE